MMNRRLSYGALVSAFLLALVAGCQKKAPEERAESQAPDSIIVMPRGSIQSGQVRLGECQAETLADSLTLTGEIQPDPLHVAHVSPRVTGTIQSVRAVVGQHVRKGELLATLYSPEFLAAQSDFLLAHERVERAAAAGAKDIISLKTIAESARRRLELLGTTEQEVKRLEANHEMAANLSLVSPIAGVITGVQTAVGKQVAAGDDLFGIADLSIVQAVLRVYERDMSRLKVGQAARVVATAYPGRTFGGDVKTLADALDEVTRTLDVRVNINNADEALKPGLFVKAFMATGAGRQAVVLDEASVQDFNGSEVVFVALSDTAFVARPVQIRPLGGGRAEIVAGLAPGTRIAMQGAFLVKSQARKSELGEE